MVRGRIVYPVICVLIAISFSCTFAQQDRDVQINVIPRELIDLPVAGTLRHREYGLGLRIYPNGGVLSDFSVGMFDRLHAVLYYGGENLIGQGDVNWNPRMGIDFRLRIVDESFLFPGIAVGVNTQGYGGYNKTLDRYSIKSRGLYVVSSRNYATIIGDAGVHIGANVSMERKDEDKDLNFFAGTNISIKKISEVLIEYDAAFNDNEKKSAGSNKGYFNIGLRFFISNNFQLTFHFKDLFENAKGKSYGREIRIEYRDSFLRW